MNRTSTNSFDGPSDAWYAPPEVTCGCDVCLDCHAWHKERNEFPKFCTMCQDEKCPLCDGRGWYVGPTSWAPEGDDTDCDRCEGTGRIFQ